MPKAQGNVIPRCKIPVCILQLDLHSCMYREIFEKTGNEELLVSLGSYRAKSWQVKQTIPELNISLTGLLSEKVVMFSIVRCF